MERRKVSAEAGEKLEENRPTRSRVLLKKLSLRRVSDSVPMVRLLDGLKKLQTAADSYLSRVKTLQKLSRLHSGFIDPDDVSVSLEDSPQRKRSRRNSQRLNMIESLFKDLKEHDDYQTYQVETLLVVALETYMSIRLNSELIIMTLKSESFVHSLLSKFEIEGGYLNLTVRIVLNSIQKMGFWDSKESCLNLLVKLYEQSRNRQSCLMSVMECLDNDYQDMSYSVLIFQRLMSMERWAYSFDGTTRRVLGKCCQLYARCDPAKRETKVALEKCLTSLVSARTEEKILVAIADHAMKGSIGKYRSDLADVLFNLCREANPSNLVGLIDSLILMMNDPEVDVVIRSYQILTLILSPTILYQPSYKIDDFLSWARNTKVETAGCHPESLKVVKNEIRHIILSMLIGYIRHAIYPKTLEAILICNCSIIIEVRDPLLLSMISYALLNLQDAALRMLPVKSMRQSFLQWSVVHLFQLVADVYSISSLKDYLSVIVSQRQTLTPFLLQPIAPAPDSSPIPPSCLMEKQQVNTIIDNWNELVEPTRVHLNGNTPSSSLSELSGWNNYYKDL